MLVAAFHGLRKPNEAFFYRNPKHSGVFLAKLSASAHFGTGKSISEALIVHWFVTSVREKYKFRTCCVQELFFVFGLAFKTIFVHNMFWACIFLVLKSVINEQSVVILWVNWFKNECYWKRFTCNQNLTMG